MTEIKVWWVGNWQNAELAGPFLKKGQAKTWMRDSYRSESKDEMMKPTVREGTWTLKD